MKKYIITILFLLFPFIVKANDKVYIESVELYENNHVEEVSKVSFSDLSINTDLKFIKVNSYITYKMIIANEEKEDYQIDNDSFKSESENIEYKYNCDDNNIVKANSKNTCYITITYVKAPLIKEVFGTTHKEDFVFPLTLSQNTNPNTSNGIRIVVAIFILSVLLLLTFITKKKKSRIIIIAIAILIPIATKALKVIKIDMNSKIEIVDNGILCSHEINDLKDYTMCFLSEELPYMTDYLKDNQIDALETLLKDHTEEECPDEECRQEIQQAKKELEVLKNLKYDENMLKQKYEEYEQGLYNSTDPMENFSDEEKYSLMYSGTKYFFNIFADMINWDPLFDNAPNKDTYKNYPEGLYVDNARFIPIIREVNDNNLRGYSLTKLTTDEAKDIINYSDLITYTKNENSIELKIKGGFKATKTLDLYGEIEDIKVDGELIITLKKDENGNVVIDQAINNPESLSQTLLHARFGFINNLIDVMVNDYRLRISRGEKAYGEEHFEKENLIEQLLSRYYQVIYSVTGIRRRDVMISETYKMDYKEKEFLKLANINVEAAKILDEYSRKVMKRHEETGEWDTLEEQNENLKEYYEYLGVPYHIGSDGLYEADEQPFDISRIDVVYNNKFYEGEEGLFKFIADYYNIDYNNSNDIKKTIYDALS